MQKPTHWRSLLLLGLGALTLLMPLHGRLQGADAPTELRQQSPVNAVSPLSAQSPLSQVSPLTPARSTATRTPTRTPRPRATPRTTPTPRS
jgi:hypothetical protein